MPLMHTSLGKIEAFFLSTNSYEDIETVDKLARNTSAIILFLVHDSLLYNPTSATEIANLPNNVFVEAFSEKPFTPTTDRVISYTDGSGQLYLNFHDGFQNFTNFHKLLSRLRQGKHIINFVNPDSEFYIAGGDTIVGDDFIIFGPLTTGLQRKYWEASSWETYRQGFESTYHYPKGSLKFLRLDDKGLFQKGASLYHLDMFINYIGKDSRGYQQFVMAKIPREFLVNANNHEELRIYQNYIDEVEDQLVDFIGADKLSIEYIPLVPGYNQDFGNFWGFHTHNNVISQVSDHGSQLFIPYYIDATYSEYDLLHAKTMEIYSNYFDSIKQIRFSRALLEIYKCSVHCFAAPLARE